MDSHPDPIPYLLACDEPWTRFRTRVDLLGQSPGEGQAAEDRAEMLAHPQINALIKAGQTWPGYALKRHNDAKHPLHTLSVLADFGLTVTDPGISQIADKIISRQTEEGAFEIKMHLYKRFGGLDGEHWIWMGCDAPELVYILAGLGLGDDERVMRAREHVLSLVEENGWRCSASPRLGNFKGPGKREDPCPIATLQALKALSLFPELLMDSRVNPGVDMLLHHWEVRTEKKYFLFGIGTDFKKPKYPLIWYDLLHFLDVLSRYPRARSDPRFAEIARLLLEEADNEGRITAASMYMAWKGWSFANKKDPSPWLTFLAARIKTRQAEGVLF